MSLNLRSMHPLQDNVQEYMYDKQFISVDSVDRNICKYPNAALFEIELPQDYQNVLAVKLIDWDLPLNLAQFSLYFNNISFEIEIPAPYDSNAAGVSDPVMNLITVALFTAIGQTYPVVIEEGNYCGEQLAIELTNAMNAAVSAFIYSYIEANSTGALLAAYVAAGQYNQFVVVFNLVSNKLLFGNKSSSFSILPVSSQNPCFSPNGQFNFPTTQCIVNQLPQYANYGLPYNMGFAKCALVESTPVSAPFLPALQYANAPPVPWLKPDPLYNITESFLIIPPYSVILSPNDYIYLELGNNLNNMDETSPYNQSEFTASTNCSNGVVKSSFAKIFVGPKSAYIPNESQTIKIYNPVAERIRKLYIRLRYHNGQLVDFGTQPFSLTFLFVLLKPQNARQMTIYDCYSAFQSR